jgi:RNA polymerase sigma-70 factor (ECF subfamily)
MSSHLQPLPHQQVPTVGAMDSNPNTPLGTMEHRGSLDNQQLADHLDRIAEGDRARFEALYRLTAPRLWAVVRRMVAQKQPAEDVLQDTYLTIWRKAHLFDRTAGDALGWMTTIARHRAIAWLRHPGNATRKLVAAPSIHDAEEAPTEGTPDGSVLFKELMDRLTSEQRESLLLVYLYGMTQEEISLALDVPLGTIKSRVRRGLIALKDLLDS